MRRIVTLAATIVVAAFVITMAAPLAANAASVPPSVMPDCYAEAPPARGGWGGGRDVIAQGTYAEDPSPVRGRTARLGEPCWGMDTLSLPVRVTDVPVPIKDDDEDGDDDGPPPTAGGTCDEFDSASPPNALDLNDATYLCNEVVPACTNQCTSWGGNYAPMPSFSVTAEQTDANSVRVTFGARDSYGTSEGSFLYGLYCKSANGTLPTEPDEPSYSFENGTRNDEFQSTLSCTGGLSSTRVPWRIYVAAWDSTGNQRRAGVAWESDDDLPEAPSGNGTGYWGGSQEAPIWLAPAPGLTIGQGVTFSEPSRVYCTDTYEGGTETPWTLMPINIVGGFGYYPPPGNNPSTPQWTVDLELFPMVADPIFTTASCPFINRIELWICTWQGNSPYTGSCAEYLWTADAWREHRPYTGDDGEDQGGLLCKIYPELEGCYDILNPPYVDGSDFGQACAGAPVYDPPAWNDFANWVPALTEWIGLSVGHYAECLFVPINGWDRDGVVEDAWQQSPIGQVNDIVTGTFAQVSNMTGTCGSLVNVTLFGTPVVIDTCSWTWAVPMRQLLTWALLALGGLGIASYLVNTTLSLIKSNAPNPVDGGKK